MATNAGSETTVLTEKCQNLYISRPTVRILPSMQFDLLLRKPEDDKCRLTLDNLLLQTSVISSSRLTVFHNVFKWT